MHRRSFLAGLAVTVASRRARAAPSAEERLSVANKRLAEIEETLQKAKPGTLAEVSLIRAGHISEQEITGIFGEDLFLPTIQSSFEAGTLDKELSSLLPEKLCADRLICPLAIRDDILDIAFVSPEAMGIVDELQLMTGLRSGTKSCERRKMRRPTSRARMTDVLA